MSRIARVALALMMVLATCTAVQAQGPVQVQQSPTTLNACNQAAHSHTTAGVLTLTPPNGQYTYLCEVDISNCAGASAVTAAAVTTVTTANFNGITWTMGSGTSAGLCQPTVVSLYGSGGLKSAAAGTTTTITLPAFATNQTLSINAIYYFAP